MSAEKKEYPALDTVEVKQEDFITQDEIDARLTCGSGWIGYNKLDRFFKVIYYEIKE